MDHHPARTLLYEESHHRSPLPMDAASVCSHLTLYTDGIANDAIIDDLRTLCMAMGSPTPDPDARQFVIQTGPQRVKWERHSEFISYTVYLPEDGEALATRTALDHLPGAWCENLCGNLLTGTHVALRPTKAEHSADQMRCTFTGRTVAGSTVCDGFARLWSDFELGPDGFSKILALLGYDAAHAVSDHTLKLEAALKTLEDQMIGQAPIANDRRLLHDLLAMARKIEDTQSEWSFRYAATRAYAEIVERRWRELNEQRLFNFLKRRFRPTLDTCGSTNTRLNALGARVHRDVKFILTHIYMMKQEQCNTFLAAMNERLHAQFRLQRTVEAISGVAISYYAIGIFSVFAKSVTELGIGVSPSQLTAMVAPFIILAVVALSRRFRAELLILDDEHTDKW